MLAAIIVSISALIYYFYFLLFHDSKTILTYFILDLAFLPISVLIVTIIIESVLTNREKQARLEKLNMVIGVFFSEVGMKLLNICVAHDQNISEKSNFFKVNTQWKKDTYLQTQKLLKTIPFKFDPQNIDFMQISLLLNEQRNTLVNMLENPMLLEHESFTTLLRAVFHLLEELSYRCEFQNIPKADLEHLIIDMQRVYQPLVYEWLNYLKFIQFNYPYLFSLAVRLNPFDQNAKVVID